MPKAPESRGSILDVVHREPDTVLSAGVVTDAAARSAGVLGEAESAARRSDGVPVGKAPAADLPGQNEPGDNSSQGDDIPGATSSHSDAFGVKPGGAIGGKADSGAADETADDPLTDALDQGDKAPSLPSRLSAVAAGYLVDELDDSDELSGVGDMYRGGYTVRRAARRFRGIRGEAEGLSGDAEADTTAAPGGGGKAGRARLTRKGEGAAKPTAGKASSAKAKATSAKRAGAVGTQKAAAAAQAGQGAMQAQAATTAAASESTVAMGTAAGTGLAAVGGVIAGIVAFLLAVLLVSHLVSALFGFWENEEMKRSVEGLPPYITYSMVKAALQCQEDYGHPAGCTLAQIIVESGVGDHLSGLASQDNNLFGIKWSSSFASCPEVVGKSSWATYEEYDGATVQIMADFTSFTSAEDCIRFRSRVLLQNSRYADNALIREAMASHDSDKMAEGLKDAGYATSSAYVDSLKSAMDTYNLRRFDTMTVEDLESSQADGNAIVAAAYSQLGVPYVWGGSTPGAGLDCSGLTQYCYACAGIQIAHYTETQLAQGTAIPLSQAQPGDILYRYGHVAIYVGGDQYIHAPQEGDVVRVASGINYFTCAIRY